MDEYEVNLIDYLRVMWKWKWIILACVVMAVLATVAVMWSKPDEFSGTSVYRLYQSLSVLGISDLDKQLVVDTVLDAKESYQSRNLTLTAEANANRIQVTVTGPVSQDTIHRAFNDLDVYVTDRLNQQVKRDVAQAIIMKSMHITQLTRQRDLLAAKIKALGSPLPDDPLLGSLAQQASSVEAQLAQEQAQLEALNGADAMSLFSLEKAAELSISQVGPNRRMSVAVAGVLGLFVGVILAFFVHYLLSQGEHKEPVPSSNEHSTDKRPATESKGFPEHGFAQP